MKAFSHVKVASAPYQWPAAEFILVTATEKETFEGVPHVFDLEAGFAFLCCLDRQQSSFSGLAQWGCA